MTCSMTAFARCEGSTKNGLLVWELRSVNHRFSEVSPRLPEELRFLEPRVRERIAVCIKRGKIDANLRYQLVAAEDLPIEIDRELTVRLTRVTREVDQLLYNPAPVNALEVLRWPGVIKVPEQDIERLSIDVLALLDDALAELLETRAREGAKLKAIIETRCEAVEAQVATVVARLPEILQTLRGRLQERVQEIQAELDPARVEQEIVILIHKADVDEELDRLHTHVTEVRRVLEQDEPVGRRLDFLMQELNREANTLGSKSVHVDLTNASVNLKVLIEQMREQIQNIE
jgi:uncharacterized protein (TIGR00255 family)